MAYLQLGNAYRHVLQFLSRGWKSLHYERIVARHDVPRRVCEGAHEVEGTVHLGQVRDDAERAILLYILVEMRGIGGEDDTASDRLDSYYLQSMGMASRQVDLDSRRYLLAPSDEAQAAREVLAHEMKHVFRLDYLAKVRPARIPARPELHLLFLHDEGGGRKLLQVADVIVMEMREDHERNRLAVYAQFSEPFGRAAKMVPTTPGGYLGAEADIDYDSVFFRNHRPDEIVHGHGRVVRIVSMKVLVAARGPCSVPDSVHLVVGNFSHVTVLPVDPLFLYLRVYRPVRH